MPLVNGIERGKFNEKNSCFKSVDFDFFYLLFFSFGQQNFVPRLSPEHSTTFANILFFSHLYSAKIVCVDKWIEHIFPGTMLQISQSTQDSYQVKVLGNAAPNVGFGITYALPILVSGLIAQEGSILIVENPEAHLHAKAQSNMGFFLARMAAAGIRVIIETHSEHIVNGIRRMIVKGQTKMSADDITIYFFQDKDEDKKIMNIGMDKKGNLSAFPEDFFDQVRQDTLAILRIDKMKGE